MATQKAKVSKKFFFEKKNQKTFGRFALGRWPPGSR
jgi:hypothetical protein